MIEHESVPETRSKRPRFAVAIMVSIVLAALLSAGLSTQWIQAAVVGIVPTDGLVLFRRLPLRFGLHASNEYANRLRDAKKRPRTEHVDEWTETASDMLKRGGMHASVGAFLFGAMAPHIPMHPYQDFLRAALDREEDCDDRAQLLWSIKHIAMTHNEAVATFKPLTTDPCALVRLQSWNFLAVAGILSPADLPELQTAIESERDSSVATYLIGLKGSIESGPEVPGTP